MQKVLNCEVEGNCPIRGEIVGLSVWNGDDVGGATYAYGGKVAKHENVGLIDTTYPPECDVGTTVMYLLGCGWKLLAPPVSNGRTHDVWLVKD